MDVVKIQRDIESVADRVVKELEEGKVVVFPTDTVYGLLADATNKQAVDKVLQIKGRKRKPLPVFVRDIVMAGEFAVIESRDEELLQEYWPGKVTAVFNSKGALPVNTGTLGTIGLRIPDYPLLNLVLEKVGVPIIGTSANLSGNSPILSGKEVIAEFAGRTYTPDVLYDAGDLPFSLPSSVVDFVHQGTVIRKGSRNI